MGGASGGMGRWVRGVEQVGGETESEGAGCFDMGKFFFCVCESGQISFYPQCTDSKECVPSPSSSLRGQTLGS